MSGAGFSRRVLDAARPPGSLHHKKLAQLFLQYTKESSSTSTTQLKAVVIAPEL
jgi:hypothetical protein